MKTSMIIGHFYCRLPLAATGSASGRDAKWTNGAVTIFCHTKRARPFKSLSGSSSELSFQGEGEGQGEGQGEGEGEGRGKDDVVGRRNFRRKRSFFF